MIPLTIGIAVLDEKTSLTHLETSTPGNAALGTAGGVDLVHRTEFTCAETEAPRPKWSTFHV
jgi:hypothetical protein